MWKHCGGKFLSSSQCLDIQGTPIATCEESKEEQNMKERLETPVEKKECYFVLEQLEEPVIIEEEEEVVEDLGDAEPLWQPRVKKTPPKRLKLMLRRNVHNLQGISLVKNWMG